MSDSDKTRPPRKPGVLNRDRVLAAAMELADADGLGALTMRSLALALGVKPMSLYHHVRDKEDLLDGMLDLVFGEIELPRTREPWRSEIRRHAVSARTVLARHPWALALAGTRTSPGPATLRHHDAVVGTLANSGFSPPMTARAYATIDAYVYGFVLQEASLPFEDPGGADVAKSVMAGFDAGRYPHLTAFATDYLTQEGYAFGDQFEPGLDLVLDAVGTLVDR
ncbi:TetR/AcrR family transcriptional regulator [Actinorugispora endophytica]|uniref:TetR family transcriptional regulator n=1 Tax=Actinorugispora endophytica TaxID=1605990 RepID=A0A4R6ULZ8_9ACTN|nr:TetR/AcrR family transcriptional regulator [Actinorugispora endophytica]TDQ47206.1 TetR family transcriptional regulator [Actinorugispora endophytica]